MTVVARGAALYAASVEVETPKGVAVTAEPGTVTVQLAYDPVSASPEAPVAGKIVGDAGAGPLEVRIESQAGYWTSGWVPATGGLFEIAAVLQPGKICPFYLYVRDAAGQSHDVAPNEFTIRHGLELSAPPLPHTISVEVVRPNGRVELDPLFPRNIPLPAEKRIQYRADHTLRPADPASALVVKLWEGEDLAEPEANEWVGNVQITPLMVKRPIPEDSELELYIRIDASRLITVEIFVPHLNQHFSEGVYLAEQEQRTDNDAATTLNRDIASFADRLTAVEVHMKQHPDDEGEVSLKKLRRAAEDLDIEVMQATQHRALNDPDQIRRLVAAGRDLRAQVGLFERKVGMDRLMAASTADAKNTVAHVNETVERYGDKVDRFEFEMRRKELEQAAERLDERAVRNAITKMISLKFAILYKQDWFWRDMFESMDKSEASFSNASAARHFVSEAERAIREGQGGKLRDAVRQLWTLQPLGAVEAAQQKALRTGLRS